VVMDIADFALVAYDKAKWRHLVFTTVAIIPFVKDFISSIEPTHNFKSHTMW